MNKEEIVNYCLTLKDTYVDMPFPRDRESIVMKHKDTGKWFAVLLQPQKNVWYVNVKTEPNYSDLLRNTYSYIIPAYHMSKEHWNTIIMEEEVDEEMVCELIKQSYALTKKKTGE